MDFKAMRKMLGAEEPYNCIFDLAERDKVPEIINYIQSYCNCDEEMAKQLFASLKEAHPGVFEPRSQWAPSVNVPKCPTCSSTNIQKISGAAKAAGAMTLGLLSKTARSQFKCNNCGYKW